MYNKLHRKAVIIAVLIVGVQTISSGTVRDPRNPTKDKVPIKVIRTRVKGR
jgi:predicted subunit of tRNA(5-methylaminomethyl-2-thiouridylate) methyltransferase